MMTAEEVLQFLKLEPLPVEGGYFRQTYLAHEKVGAEALPRRYGREKSLGTAIYYLLTPEPGVFSALHKLPTDEIYHFYLGDAVEMLLLFPEGRSERIVLGQDILAGQRVQFVAPREVWQGSRLIPGGRWALLGTTMAPGFDERDYVGGQRDELIERYPDRADLIRTLTRPDEGLSMKGQ